MTKKKIFLFLTFLVFLFFLPSLKENYIRKNKLKSEIQEIDKKIAEYKKKIELNQLQIDRLENEFELEKLARYKLQMVKKNEEIYRFIRKEQEE